MLSITRTEALKRLQFIRQMSQMETKIETAISLHQRDVKRCQIDWKTPSSLMDVESNRTTLHTLSRDRRKTETQHAQFSTVSSLTQVQIVDRSRDGHNTIHNAINLMWNKR